MSGTPDPAALFTLVSMIPRGRVASYGQLATLLNRPQNSRWVGSTLSKMPPDTEIPWHRVVNSQGHITCPSSAEARSRLIAEGVVLKNNRVSMPQYQWRP